MLQVTKITGKIKLRVDILKAMAHPARLLMLQELAKGERCVNDLREMVGTDLSTVSKHLSLLRKAGLVEIDKRGPQVFYGLTTPCVLQFIDCIDVVVRSNAKRQLKHLE